VSLDSWRDSRLIVEHETSRQEISELREIVRTDLEDARIEELSPDRRLSCCYGALLTAARAALRASGYRVPKGTPNHHYYAIQSLQYTVGLDTQALRHIESIGKKRATADYVRVGEVSESMVLETIAFAEGVCSRVIDWIRTEHPTLLECSS
jgi:hypothetical protein